VAVNVTLTPAQIVVALPDMLTLTGKFGFTVIVSVLDVAGFPVGQIALEVRTQVIKSPLASELLE
jgi:hypothetical protein